MDLVFPDFFKIETAGIVGTANFSGDGFEIFFSGCKDLTFLFVLGGAVCLGGGGLSSRGAGKCDDLFPKAFFMEEGLKYSFSSSGDNTSGSSSRNGFFNES